MSRFVSSDGFTRCISCRRHVIAGATPAATVCPFCASGSSRPVQVGALGLAFLALACGPTQTDRPESEPEHYEPANEPVQGEVYGTPPMPEPEPGLPESTESPE